MDFGKKKQKDVMKLTTTLPKTILALCCLGALALPASAAVFTVSGTADPWLANAAIDNLGTPEPADVAPGQSPVLAGSFAPGSTVTWSATGRVGHPGDVAGPDGASWAWTSRNIGANNGINDLYEPICSLIGVWAYPGGGTAFFMGSNGSAVVPAGATELFLGTMDGYGWANNVGEFIVEINGANSVPDAGATAGLMVLGLGLLALARRQSRA